VNPFSVVITAYLNSIECAGMRRLMKIYFFYRYFIRLYWQDGKAIKYAQKCAALFWKGSTNYW